MGQTIELTSADGFTFPAYVAQPSAKAKGGLVLLQEIFGVNPGIRKKCDDWAEAGYLAIAPDLFWRLKPGIELDPDVPAEFQEALGWMGKFDQTQGIADIEATTFAALESAYKRVETSDVKYRFVIDMSSLT